MNNKISLCVIAGNVERYIQRFIDSFQPLVDEICVVRAIGNQEPDRTLEIAEAAGCRTGEYINSRTTSAPLKDEAGEIAGTAVYKAGEEWPHVDDFAAARNQACEMASHDWLMWADTDDLIEPDSIDQIKRLIADLEGQEVDGVLMAYVIPEDGVINWRERLWRKGTATWENPVHECLRFKEGTRHARFEGARILHASERRSAARDERNLRILESIPEEERTISQKFHVFQSLIALDRNEEALMKAMEFAQLPEAGKNERYEAFFQLARLAGDDETKKSALLQAVAIDPTRREAFGELGLACLPADPDAALGWTEAMLALKLPRESPWNLRRSYYGHLGVHLRGMALRAANRHAEANALEQNHFIRSGAKISLLHASRGRPAQAWRARMEWLRLASDPDAIEHIFGLDLDDEQSIPLALAKHAVSHGRNGPVGAWNAAAERSSGEVLVQLSDDFAPFPGWDKAILEAIGDTSEPKVLAVSDGHRNDDLLCMAILTRARYKQQGHMFHPEFFSMHSDNWFSKWAFDDGVVIDARDSIVFEHLHPVFGKAPMDETYARSNADYRYRTGKGIFDRLVAGVKVSAEIDGWFDFRDFYDLVAQNLEDGDAFVEVGSWKGQSLIYLAHRLEDLGKTPEIHAVDTFEGDSDTGRVGVWEEFRDNMNAADSKFGITHACASVGAAGKFNNASVAGVFIDAAHDYESVKADIAAWLPKVKPGGIFAGHDIDAPGVLKAVQEAGFEYEVLGRVWIKKP